MKESRKKSITSRSTVRSTSTIKSPLNPKFKGDVIEPALDELSVNIISLRLSDYEDRNYNIKVSFFNQLLVNASIQPSSARDAQNTVKPIVGGTMSYDPSDYEKMCLFADYPLAVKVQPINLSGKASDSGNVNKLSSKGNIFSKSSKDISCCNIDILPIFIGKDILCIKKRMQPLIEPSIREQRSWCNLPLLTLEVSVKRNPDNLMHHKLLGSANYMQLTLVGVYNMIVRYNENNRYVALSKLPLHNDLLHSTVTYENGSKQSERFNPTNFYRKWEILRSNSDDNFSEADEKFACCLRDISSEEVINLEDYILLRDNNTIWGSFHRTLLLEDSAQLFRNHIRQYKWPLEFHIQKSNGEYSFMAFLDLFHLLYPGEHKLRLAVPIKWIDPILMMEECGCSPTPRTRASGNWNRVSGVKSTDTRRSSVYSHSHADFDGETATGVDGGPAFVIVEVKLGRALTQITLPPHITEPDIHSMLLDLERMTCNRKCTGRGQLDKDWQNTVRLAVNALHKVPYYGMTGFSTFNRQLSKSRSRVEVMTSFCADAAKYVNNNFVVQDYIQSDDLFFEMLMMAHTCLMRSVHDALPNVGRRQELDSGLRAARHARHVQDTQHSADLYLKCAYEQKRNPDIWRELATCLKDIDLDWAQVCLYKATFLNPRHPLTLLSMGCMVFDQDPDGAEVFFAAILALYPYWTAGWIVVSVFYHERQLYSMADKIMELIMINQKASGPAKTLSDDITCKFTIGPRSWENELGDWWDPTPLPTDENCYFNAADLLLRMRAITLAEACLARGLSEYNESPQYYHLLALCCTLRGDIDNALCHLKTGVEKFGKESYLKSLEAECLLKKNKVEDAMTAFREAGECINAYCILQSLPMRGMSVRSVLVDLLHRQPSAYAWLALAEDWLKQNVSAEAQTPELKSPKSRAAICAISCAVQALKIDRRSGPAWAMLTKHVKHKTRHQFYKNMANACGHWTDAKRSSSTQSVCFRYATAMRVCRCDKPASKSTKEKARK